MSLFGLSPSVIDRVREEAERIAEDVAEELYQSLLDELGEEKVKKLLREGGADAVLEKVVESEKLTMKLKEEIDGLLWQDIDSALLCLAFAEFYDDVTPLTTSDPLEFIRGYASQVWRILFNDALARKLEEVHIPEKAKEPA